MNKIFFLFLLIILFSCEQPNDQKQQYLTENDPNETDPPIARAGENFTTHGWADQQSGGVYYALADEILYINDENYPEPLQKRMAFTSAIAGDNEKLLILEGNIDLSDGLITDEDKSAYDEFDSNGQRVHKDIQYPIGSNTTLLGQGEVKLMFGGLKIKDESRVIIRNIHFWDAYGSTEYDTSLPEHSSSKASADALLIEGISSGIWIDHCTFSDGISTDLIRNYHHDGLIDIKGGKNITISWCEFTNHDKVMLIGSNDSSYLAPEERQITLHHNYFHECTQRMPRSRGTQMHLYNNLYNMIGVSGNSGYCLGPGMGSQYIVENNLFGHRLGPIVKYYDSSTSVNASTFSQFFHRGNSPQLSSTHCSYDSSNDYFKDFTIHQSSTMPWKIPYSYDLNEVSELKSMIEAEAGSGRLY